MRLFLLPGIYVLFFLSGAAALIYQVVWVRSLTLVFGGSHLAITTVLSIFMAGLALGGYAIGKYADASRRPLRLYGLLELGIAASAVVFAGLIAYYPSIYIPLAQGRDDSPLFLSIIRILFSVLALILPTTLMGGTLPVLSSLASRKPETVGKHLAFLYGFNTLGAVAGALGAGFILLRFYSASTALYTAVAMNAAIGVASLLLDSRSSSAFATTGESPAKKRASQKTAGSPVQERTGQANLIAWGIGISGFCALGYEVLWTRILTIVAGANVYSFTVMLSAFLSGIALGSKAYGLLQNRLGIEGERAQTTWFGGVQIAIGVTALLVTAGLRYLPVLSVQLPVLLEEHVAGHFVTGLWIAFALAFLTMFVPAFLMGIAFPLAGAIHAGRGERVGSAVGRILAWNTAGAILGAAASGFVMIYAFGIERSLQMLTLVNIGFGLVVLAIPGGRRLQTTAACAAAGLLLVLAVAPGSFRIWNTEYFAIFRNNQPEAFSSSGKTREALANTDVLYYAEGVESIVSAIKVRGGSQAFLTNGRVEASTDPAGQIHLYTLGHLPMLLHPKPENVLVIGTGSGMTLGAVTLHPTLRRATLAEIEPSVLGVARTFSPYNHNALDNPRVRITFNDGRNFLLTTRERFDVITADPIHPWFRGAGYLYTDEYFKLAGERLAPGGIMCQWLPVYELSQADIASIVKTFSRNFKHSMIWLTHVDAELIGSHEPIVIDEAELERRIARPEIRNDLERVMMGSAGDFLSYFLMGTRGVTALGAGATINTDDNLRLEFSAPLSIGRTAAAAEDLALLYRYRESILPYLRSPDDRQQRLAQAARWIERDSAMAATGRASVLFAGGDYMTKAFERLALELDREHDSFAPWRFLKNEYRSLLAMEPRLIQARTFAFTGPAGAKQEVQIAAVESRISAELAVLDFVNSDERTVYGTMNIPGKDRDRVIARVAGEVMQKLQRAYDEASREAFPPQAAHVLKVMKQTIEEGVRSATVELP